MSEKRSKKKVMDKILEMGLVYDKKELYKKRKGGGGKSRKNRSSDDEDDDDRRGSDSDDGFVDNREEFAGKEYIYIFSTTCIYLL